MRVYDSIGRATGEAMRRNAERAAELAEILTAGYCEACPFVSCPDCDYQTPEEDETA